MVKQVLSEFQCILVPGMHDSGRDHWQSRWERAHPQLKRVRQDDWDHPALLAWSERLDQLCARDPRPALLVAHSFGCLASVHSIARGGAIAGALLVAPADPDKFNVANILPATPLACPTIVVASTNDPWMSAARAAHWAARWDSALVVGGALGHINAESRLGDWPDGWAHLQRLFALARRTRQPSPA